VGKLIIVESPAKAKTIKKYLGRGYNVVASMGHVRDLPKSKMGIDIENGFEPQYINIKGKGKIISELKAAAKKADMVYLAADPDREGEAISWHLAHILGLDLNQENRVTFNEITKSGVQNGMANPRRIDIDRFYAQQARRVLDRIVGYELSPFLWRKVKKGLSAGRVQSAVVKLIVDRENEIRAFVPSEYWTIEATHYADDCDLPFVSKLILKDGKKIEITDKDQSDRVISDLQNSSFEVDSIKRGVKKRNPAAPFTTSTMQQEASRKLGFQSRRTMQTAQQLYEGVDVGEMGAVGLITYMRTDSLRVSKDAQDAAANYILENFGQEYLPAKRRSYAARGKAQDAHEAIRPSMPELTPAQVKPYLTSDQYKLYSLIWRRFIASQMAQNEKDTVTVDLKAGRYTFRANGYSVRFDGFTRVYTEGRDTDGEEETALPDIMESSVVKTTDCQGNQHFTEPPARFTEATLIKAMEENGIGRPSTYTPTITTVMSRGYVERNGKILQPTPLGEVTTKLLSDHFETIVDVDFTAHLENDLDKISEGDAQWVDIMTRFYDVFKTSLDKAEKEMEGTRVKVPDEETDIVCEQCGRKMVIRTGKFGKFLACPGFPECTNTKAITVETQGTCPECGGRILEKKSKRGRKFFGCENNPKCGFMTWDEPTGEKCPNCGSTLFKKTGRFSKLYCQKENCGFQKEVNS